MSFGLCDKDWVDPDPVQIIQCYECVEWHECPCGCRFGWCECDKIFTFKTDECEYGQSRWS